MRRALSAAAAVAVIGLAAPAATGHSGYVDISNQQFSPARAIGVPGEVVSWHWRGPDTNHSVTADDGSFDSDPGKTALQISHAEGDTFSYLFEKVGTFGYHCKVHPGMTGTVVIRRAPKGDTAPPRLRRVRARVQRKRVVVRFRVSEAASVLAELRRAGRRRVLRDSFRFVRRGDRRTAIGLRGVGRGRFTVRLRAQDDAGNQSRVRVVGIRR